MDVQHHHIELINNAVPSAIDSLNSLSKLRVVDLAEFLAMDLPKRELILTPWLPKAGLAMIHAMPGIGKTHVSLSIAYAVASGGEFLNWEAEIPRGVLFIDGEMPAAALQERLAQIVKMNGDSQILGKLKIVTPDLQENGIPDLATIEGQAAINELITEGIDLLILDNLSSLIRSGKENESESWQPLQAWLLELRRKGISVLLIHHSGKGGTQRGASKRADVLDTVICLTRPEGYTQDQGARFNVTFEKSRGFFGDDAKSFEATLCADHQANLIWTTSTLKETSFQKVVRLLIEGKTKAEAARELGLHASTVGRHAAKAHDQGLIKKAIQ